MDLIKQAFGINATKKSEAKKWYEEAVKEMVNKSYVMCSSDPHVELSAIFGEHWCLASRGGLKARSAGLFAEANIAFNYANSVYGTRGKFASLAKVLVDKEVRVSDEEIDRYGTYMNMLLTATTESAVQKQFNKRK